MRKKTLKWKYLLKFLIMAYIMKVVILGGDQGIRLREEKEFTEKHIFKKEC